MSAPSPSLIPVFHSPITLGVCSSSVVRALATLSLMLAWAPVASAQTDPPWWQPVKDAHANFPDNDAARATVRTSENATLTLVLIDESGSMDDLYNAEGATKWDEAIRRLREEFGRTQHSNRLYAIGAFSGDHYAPILEWQKPTDSLPGTNPAVAWHAFERALHDGTLAPGGATPLAYSFCQAVDAILDFDHNEIGFNGSINLPNTKIVHLHTDGFENNSEDNVDADTQCVGPDSEGIYPDLDEGSWMWLMRNKAFNGDAANSFIPEDNGLVNILLDVDSYVFDFIPTHEDTTVEPSSLMMSSQAFMQLQPDIGGRVEITDEQYKLNTFFRGLAEETGGVYRINKPDEVHPVEGDFNGDRCVDSEDGDELFAIMGMPVEHGNPIDLNKNGQIDVYDQVRFYGLFGQGDGCEVSTPEADSAGVESTPAPSIQSDEDNAAPVSPTTGYTARRGPPPTVL